MISAIAARTAVHRGARRPRRGGKPAGSGAPSISAAAPDCAACAFAAQVDHITGIDLSPRMIELCPRHRALCRTRGRRDAGGPARPAGRQRGTDSCRRRRWSMSRISCLSWREAKRVLAPGGLLAFTVETHRSEGVILGEGLRYAHSAEYVRGSIGEAGLALSRLDVVGPRRGQHPGAGVGRGRGKL